MSMTGQIDLVIFDCDGVLVDSEKLSIEVDRRVLADLGWSLSHDEILHPVRRTLLRALPR